MLSYVLFYCLLFLMVWCLVYFSNLCILCWLIDMVIVRFGVNLVEVVNLDLCSYVMFNQFFICVLKFGVCVVDFDLCMLVMLVDGWISQFGVIEDGWIFQVKGQLFIVVELLGDVVDVEVFCYGLYVIVYFLLKDYYCVYMLWIGILCEMVYVFGWLFSVGLVVVNMVLGLFVCNEWLVCYFDIDFGLMVLVMVGVLLVLGVEMVWGGEEILCYGDMIMCKDYCGKGIILVWFVEMVCFNYGFMVIVLLLLGVVDFVLYLDVEYVVQLGQVLVMLC